MDDEHIQKHETEASDTNRQTMMIAMLGVIVIGVCALLFMGFLWLQPGQSSRFSEMFPTSTPTLRPTLTPAPTRTLAPNLTATQGAWIKPLESPALASVEEARSAFDSGGVYLESFAWTFPDMPEVNQPGDIYIFDIPLNESNPLIWSYGWCTTTAQILEENYAHIKLEFTLNETVVPLSNFAIVEYARADGSPCREYVALVAAWPTGQHQLETRITFTQDIHDGWDLYRAGTHIFKYLVSLEP